MAEYGLVGPGGRPVVRGHRTHPSAPNLFFIGFTNPISGNLREVGIEGRRIARAVARARAAGTSPPLRPEAEPSRP